MAESAFTRKSSSCAWCGRSVCSPHSSRSTPGRRAGSRRPARSDRARPDPPQAGPLLLQHHHGRQRHPHVPADPPLDRPAALGDPRHRLRHAAAWVVDEFGITPRDFWAPDITYFDGQYHLYYAASSFGTNNSVIGLATTTTLDPDSARTTGGSTGAWCSARARTDNFNAIDPDLVFDERGRAVAVVRLVLGRHQDAPHRPGHGPAVDSGHDALLARLPRRGGRSRGRRSSARGGTGTCSLASTSAAGASTATTRWSSAAPRSIPGPYIDRDGVPLLAGRRHRAAARLQRVPGYRRRRRVPDQRRLVRAPLLRRRRRRRCPRLGAADLVERAAGRASATRSAAAAVGPRPRLGSRGQPGHRRRGANPTCGYEGADIRIADRSASACQQWRLEDRGDG